LYEWCVATGTGSNQKLSPVGVTDAEPWARAQMLEALEAVPLGTPAMGWVVAMLYLPVVYGYERLDTRACAQRASNGTLHMLTDHIDD
jgi:hypothetical protein